VSGQEMIRKNDIGVGYAGNIAGTFQGVSGLFTSAVTEAPVMATALKRQHGLLSYVPHRFNDNVAVEYAFIQTTNPTSTAAPETACAAAPVVSLTTSKTTMNYNGYGKRMYRTETINPLEAIKRANRGVRSDFYVIGDVYSDAVLNQALQAFQLGTPYTGLQSSSRDYITMSVALRKMMDVAQAFYAHVSDKFWTGNPVNNTSGGYAENIGLSHFIRNDYGTISTLNTLLGYTFVSGNDATLNSSVYDFNAVIGQTNAGGLTIYDALWEMTTNLFHKAELLRVVPDYLVVMRPEAWERIALALPYQMTTLGLFNAIAGASMTAKEVIQAQTNLYSGQVGAATAMTQQMLQTKILPIAGRELQVVTDDSLPGKTDVGGGGRVVSDIYFIPMSVNGEPVLFWETPNYQSAVDAVSTEMFRVDSTTGFYTDGGKFFWSSQKNYACYDLQAQMEPRLCFLAPHLAGKITEVDARRSTQMPTWNPAVDVVP